VIVWGVWLFHLLALAFVATRHEPWQDETHAWRLAIDSADLRQLVANAGYEGHPLLWYVLLHAIGKISRAWWVVVALHTAIASATAWLILRCAPMPLWQRVMLVFGYYLAYEYAIIVRSYGLGVLLVVSACCAWTGQRRRPWLVGLLLLVLANTSVMGLILAGAAAFGFFVDWAFPDDGQPSPTLGRIARAAVMLGAGGLLAASLVSLQVVPPADHAYRGDGAIGGSVSAWALASSLAMPAKAFLPSATLFPGSQRWQFGLVYPASRLQWALADLLAALMLLLALITCLRRRSAVAALVAGSAVMLAFTFLVLQGGPRHHGHLVLIWIVSLWLAAAGSSPPSWAPTALQRAGRLAPVAFIILQLPLLVASVQFYVGDVRLPFSDAANTARAVKALASPGEPIIAATPADGMSVAALLDLPVYSAMDGHVATFAMWGSVAPELRDVPDGAPLEHAATERAVRLMLDSACQALLVRSPAIPLSSALEGLSTRVYQTSGETMTSERFEIWRVVAPPRAGRAC
jgi:hypothetical protein